ncbi:MAG: ribonuclease III [Bacteroidota bacterium]|nr:ribonuclease III [Bacteroidota bacterium]
MKFIKKIFSRKTRPALAKDGFFDKIFQITGLECKDITIYQNAFIHSSVNKIDDNGNIISYERLEFLGDAMLGAIIADYLFRQVPDKNEGYLTKMRAKIVSRENLNNIGNELKLITLMKSNTSVRNYGQNIQGNLLEALIGAVYLDKGYQDCEKFILKVMQPYLSIERLEGKIISYKSLLLEWCQKEKKIFEIKTTEDESAVADKYFSARLFIDGQQVSKARATSKKKAEEIASKRAYFAFQEKITSK